MSVGLWSQTLIRSRPLTVDLAELPPDPDPARLPRVGTRLQLAHIHNHYYGPISPRTLEVAPIPYRLVNGVAVYDVPKFLVWAQARFDAAPLIMGGRGSQRKRTK